MSTHREHGGYSLMVHGGAGALDESADPARYRSAVERVLAHGGAMLAAGAAALDVVGDCAAMLEDDPLFNAGYGSVLNAAGGVEMDAAIMDGRDLAAGAVAAVHNIANPVRLARRVMERTAHVLLAGEGAMQFARQCALPRVDDDYFLLPERVAQLERVRRTGGAALDHDADGEGPHGTIGAVARDLHGDLAAATSTGGMVNKAVGRVGDSPVVGAGVFADNASCAVSATGHGEDFLRCTLARRIADLVELCGLDARQAAVEGVAYLARRVDGHGGVIVIDHAGRCASAFNTRHMIRGWIEHAGDVVVRI